MKIINRNLLIGLFLLLLFNFNCLAQLESRFGHSIAPITDSAIPLRVLLVFVEFDGGTCSPNQHPCWPDNQVPFNADDYFDDVASTTPNGYYSKYLYESSFGKFQVIGNSLNSVVHVPCSVLTSGSGGYPNYAALNTFINNALTTSGITHGRSLSDFDNYDFSDSPPKSGIQKLATSNGGIDFLIVCYGNSTPTGIQCGSGKGCGAGALALGNIGGKTIDTGCDFFMCGDQLSEDFILEEFFHALFGGNNFHTSNGASSHTFPFQTNNCGMSVQLSGGGMSNVVCGWDRLWLGWESDNNNNYIESYDDLNNLVSTDLDILTNPNPSLSGTYVLRDFVSTGDVVRIKLPHIDFQQTGIKNQYLWIENHQQVATYDHSVKYKRANATCGAEQMCGTDLKKGIYTYLQVGKDVTTGSNIYSSAAGSPNGLASWLFPLTAEGSYDQVYDIPNPGPFDICSRPVIINDVDNTVLTNSFTGYSSIYGLPNTNADDYILYKTFISNGTFLPDLFQGCSFKRGGIVSHDLDYAGNERVAFSCGSSCPTTGKKILSLSTNPSPFPVLTVVGTNNHSTPNTNTTLDNWENRTVWLNGLSISILDEDQTTGDVKIKIRWDDYDVENNVRWCADTINLSPNDININNYSLNIKNASSVLIDRGLSPTFTVAKGIFNGHKIFSNPTHFNCLPDSKINIEANGSIVVDNGSTMKLESTSRIDIKQGAKIIVRRGGKLILNSNSIINIENGGRVVIENDGFLEYNQDAHINLSGINSVFEIAGHLHIGDGATFTANSPQYGYFLFSNTSMFPSRNITAGNNSNINFSGTSQNNKLLQINQETFYAPANLGNFTINNGKVTLASDSRLQADGLNTTISFSNAKFTSNTPGVNNGHRGVHLYGQPNVTIDQCIFEYGATGIYAFLTYGGAPLNITYSIFRNNTKGISSYDKGCNLDGCYFFNNEYGFIGSNMSFSSIGKNCIFNGNSMGVYWQSYSSASYLLDNPYISNNSIGIRAQSSPLKLQCGSISNNDIGINVRYGANLIMDDNVPSPPADLTAFGNNSTINSWRSGGFYLNKGNNDLTTSGILSQRVIFGTVLSGGANPIIANYNKWNTTGNISSNDYLITDMNGNNISINDFNPLHSIVACGQAIPPCPNPPCDIFKSPLEYCPVCDIINTDDFINKKLNEATKVSLDKVKSNEPLNYRKAIKLFYQILIENIPNPDPKESYLLSFNYMKLLETLGYAFSSNQISCDENRTDLCLEVQMVIEIENKFIDIASQQGNYYRKYLYTLDKAQTYRIACRRDECLDVLANLLTWVEADDLDEVNSLICKVKIERDVLAGSIDISAVAKLIDECQSGNQLRLAHANGNSISNNMLETEISIFPNPILNQAVIKTSIEHGRIILFDGLGRLLSDEIISYDADVNFTGFPSGVYTLKVENTETSEYWIKRLVVQ